MEEIRGYGRVTGTREEIIKELEERAEGWHWMASDRKRDRALEAAQGVRDGSFSVKVGNTIYMVREREDTAVPEPRADRDETTDNSVS
ncbi:hypothetical protein ACFWIB_41905 [Streptomyces sp. NPDC127051]|uniref:hypothetical protein n=1 Tax=Streptomyces sp. NPDC127051 TaxID=3347119 RepID=UPI00365F440F